MLDRATSAPHDTAPTVEDVIAGRALNLLDDWLAGGGIDRPPPVLQADVEGERVLFVGRVKGPLGSWTPTINGYKLGSKTVKRLRWATPDGRPMMWSERDEEHIYIVYAFRSESIRFVDIVGHESVRFVLGPGCIVRRAAQDLAEGIEICRRQGTPGPLPSRLGHRHAGSPGSTV